MTYRTQTICHPVAAVVCQTAGLFAPIRESLIVHNQPARKRCHPERSEGSQPSTSPRYLRPSLQNPKSLVFASPPIKCLISPMDAPDSIHPAVAATPRDASRPDRGLRVILLLGFGGLLALLLYSGANAL